MFRRRYLSGLMFQSNELLTVFVLQRSLVKAEQTRTALPRYSLRAPFIPFNYRLLYVFTSIESWYSANVLNFQAIIVTDELKICGSAVEVTLRIKDWEETPCHFFSSYLYIRAGFSHLALFRPRRTRQQARTKLRTTLKHGVLYHKILIFINYSEKTPNITPQQDE